MEDWQPRKRAKVALKVQVVEFSDYVTPDKALADGELDLVSYQHKPFLDNFNKTNKTDLVPIGNAILMRMGIYSDKLHDVKDIPDGATIAIPNDPDKRRPRSAAVAACRLVEIEGWRWHEGYTEGCCR